MLTRIAVASLLLLAAATYAGGPADRVIGHFSIVACCPIAPDPLIRHREYFAKEANGNSPQSGFMYSIDSNDTWYMMDFNDTADTCINVYGDGLVRIGGLVSDGNAAAVGRYFGFDLQNWRKGRYQHKHGATLRFIGPGGVDDSGDERRDNFMHWCHTGEYEWGVSIDRMWPNVVVRGSRKIINSKADGD